MYLMVVSNVVAAVVVLEEVVFVLMLRMMAVGCGVMIMVVIE